MPLTFLGPSPRPLINLFAAFTNFCSYTFRSCNLPVTLNYCDHPLYSTPPPILFFAAFGNYRVLQLRPPVRHQGPSHGNRGYLGTLRRRCLKVSPLFILPSGVRGPHLFVPFCTGTRPAVPQSGPLSLSISRPCFSSLSLVRYVS